MSPLKLSGVLTCRRRWRSRRDGGVRREPPTNTLLRKIVNNRAYFRPIFGSARSNIARVEDWREAAPKSPSVDIFFERGGILQ